MIYVLSGGASLNFAVVGGTSAPAAPAENTIWVNTAAAVTGYVFGGTQPVSPEEGTVWLKTGVSSTTPINVLKKNAAYVYPTSCWQYVSGAWVGKSAEVWQNGGWVSWREYLYTQGQANDGLWTGKGLGVQGYEVYAEAPAVTWGADCLTVKSSSQNKGGIYYRTGKLDLTGFSKICVETGAYANAGYTSNALTYVKVYSSFNTADSSEGQVAAASLMAGNATVTLDVSGLTGSYYVGVSVHSTASIQVKNIWLE